MDESETDSDYKCGDYGFDDIYDFRSARQQPVADVSL